MTIRRGGSTVPPLLRFTRGTFGKAEPESFGKRFRMNDRRE